MKVRLVAKCAVACALGVLIFAGRASAQWSSSVTVSGAVEPVFGGQSLAGVTSARCGNSVVVGFGDSETDNKISAAGYAVSSDGGKTFADKGTLPADPTDNFGFGGQFLGTGAAGPDGGGT